MLTKDLNELKDKLFKKGLSRTKEEDIIFEKLLELQGDKVETFSLALASTHCPRCGRKY